MDDLCDLVDLVVLIDLVDLIDSFHMADSIDLVDLVDLAAFTPPESSKLGSFRSYKFGIWGPTLFRPGREGY